jgi:gliding motility-associated-like protein
MKIKLLLTFLLLMLTRIGFSHSGGVWIANDGCGHWYAIIFHYHGGSGDGPTASNASAGLYIDYNKNGVFDVGGTSYEYTDVSGFQVSNGEFSRFTDWIDLTDKDVSAHSYGMDPSIQNEVVTWLNTNKSAGKNYSIDLVIDAGDAESTWYEALVVPIRPISPGTYKASTSTSSAVETPYMSPYDNPFSINYYPVNGYTQTSYAQSICGDKLQINTEFTQTCIEEFGIVYSLTNPNPAIAGVGVTTVVLYSGPSKDLLNEKIIQDVDASAAPANNVNFKAYYKQTINGEQYTLYGPLLNPAAADPALDCDGDGIPNGIEMEKPAKDTDLDGVPDFMDLDSDNDGTTDASEGGIVDCDGDGIKDYHDGALSVEFIEQPELMAFCSFPSTAIPITFKSNSFTAIHQWQVNTNDGNGFTNIVNNTVYSGSNSDSLSISNHSSAMRGFEYRVISSVSACALSVTSDTVSLMEGAALPVARDTSYYLGATAINILNQVTGDHHGYLYFFSNSAAGWDSYINPIEPATTSVGLFNFWVRQEIMDAEENWCLSEPVKLTVKVTAANSIDGSLAAKTTSFPLYSIVDDSVNVSGPGMVKDPRVVITSGFHAGDSLAIMGPIIPGVTYVYNIGTGVMKFTGVESAAEWQAILRRVAFQTSSSDLSDRTFTFMLADDVDPDNPDLTLQHSKILTNGTDLAGPAIPENTVSGSTIHFNPTLYNTYQLVSGEGDTDNNSFSFAGGELKTKDALDFETRYTYSIRLKVTDHHGNTMEQKYIVTILDVNEAPVIAAEQQFTLDENSATGSAVGTVIASDPDGTTKFTEWSIVGGNTGNAFSINPITGALTVSDSSAVDFELANQFQLSIRTSDGLLNSNIQTVTILINNVSDTNVGPTALSISKATFHPAISSTEAIGIFTTTDEDDTVFAYELIPGEGDENNSMFTVVGDKLYLKNNSGLSGLTIFTIRVRTTDASGAVFEKILTIVKTGFDQANITIPGTFSPNGDGINDTWIPAELRFYNDVKVEIFDRSGVPLFKTNDPEQGWDGRTRQGTMLEGPFFYIIQINDVNVTKKGVLISIK